MNKRQAKKKRTFGEEQYDIWGYPMSYNEQRQVERQYHEYIVTTEYRNITDDSDAEELASILGITYQKQERRYTYPNRLRIRNIHKAVMKSL